MKITRKQLRQIIKEAMDDLPKGVITKVHGKGPYVVIINAGQGRQAMWPKSSAPGVYSREEAEAIAKEQNRDSRAMGFGSIHYHAQPLSRDLLGGRYGVLPGNEAYIGLKKLLDRQDSDRAMRAGHEQEVSQDPAWDSDSDMKDPDSIDSQDMADAKRYAGHKGPEGMAKYLGISVEDWHRIRAELDDHYEDRFLDDQDAFDDDYPKVLGYKHPETGENVMISVQSDDDMDDILDPLLRQYPDLAYSID